MNKWTPLNPMDKPRSNTSMTSINDRHVFIFQGLVSPQTQQSSNSVIEYMDLGGLDQNSFIQARWQPIIVKNQDFIYIDLKGSAAINQKEIMVFGGSTTKCFYIDVQMLKNSNEKQGFASKMFQSQPLQISNSPSIQLMNESKFCVESDFTVRTFGNYLYAVDGNLGNLHVYSVKDKQWNFS